jgi:hypothetical protein
MVKTLILNLGTPGRTDTAPPVGMANIKIDEDYPSDIQALYMELDASTGEPGRFCLTRSVKAGGQVWTTDEAHYVASMSLIIEYQEDH